MKASLPPPRLILCAATWSLVAFPTSKREWSVARKLKEVRRAGFDGICGYINPEIKTEAGKLGLGLMSGFDAKDTASALPRLDEQRALGVRFINIQLMNHDTLPAAAAREAVKLIRESKKRDLSVHVEVHRDTSTETPEKFSEIADLYEKATGELMPVTWDHSHFAVSKHVLPAGYSERLLAWPELIQHSQMFHLRPFNSQHLQVPVTNGRGKLTPEFKDYLDFVENLFGVWLAGPRPGNELWACPEIGMSHGYQLSSFPHAWPEAVVARTEILGAWERALVKKPPGKKEAHRLKYLLDEFQEVSRHR